MLFQVKDYVLPEKISSASIVECARNTLWILGDDSSLLFQTDIEGNIIREIPLNANLPPTRIPKPIKPDWEGGTLIQRKNTTIFVAVGSGSLSPERDKGFYINLDEPEKPTDFLLTSFYNQLRADAQIHSLNIEALITFGQKILLINRGGSFQPSQLIAPDFDILNTENDSGSYHIITIETPEIRGVQSGISGATYDEDTRTLIFCASAENTEDTYNDGEILGSIIGIIPNFDEKIKSRAIFASEVRYTDEICREKIESLCVTGRIGNSEIHLVAVSDNDGATGHLFHLTLFL